MTGETKRRYPTFKRRNVGHPENLIMLMRLSAAKYEKADPSAQNAGLGMTA